MNETVHPLAQLKAIHLPQGVSLWPLAPGWYFLAVLILVLLASLIFLWVRRAQKARAKKQALIQLKQFKTQFQQDKNYQAYAENVAILLKRVAMSYYPKTQVTAMQGKNWQTFLDAKLKEAPFSQGEGRKLFEAVYNPHCQFDIAVVHQLCESWIKLNHPIKKTAMLTRHACTGRHPEKSDRVDSRLRGNDRQLQEGD